MELKQWLDKNVKVTLKNGKVYEGEIVEFSSAWQNLVENDWPEVASIEMQQDSYVLALFENEIDSIVEIL